MDSTILRQVIGQGYVFSLQLPPPTVDLNLLLGWVVLDHLGIFLREEEKEGRKSKEKIAKKGNQGNQKKKGKRTFVLFNIFEIHQSM